jgi:glycosyltransferase involved in cell wall biosynthesis
MDSKEFESRKHRPVGQDGFLETQLPRSQVSGQVISRLQHFYRSIPIVDFIGVMQVKIQRKRSQQAAKEEHQNPGIGYYSRSWSSAHPQRYCRQLKFLEGFEAKTRSILPKCGYIGTFEDSFAPMNQPLLSVVITVYNEEDNIQPLLDATYAALAGMDYEVILVEDGSTDRTVAEVKKYANTRTKLVIFNRNYGQTTALAAGIDQATGQYIATMDGDLQNDPSDLPGMLQKAIDEKWDVVAGRRINRKDGFVLRKIPSKIANWIIRNSTNIHLKDYGCTLRVYKAEIAQNMGLYGELHRFIPVLAKQQGAKMTEVDVKHHPRIHGNSKYGLSRTFKVMADLILMLFFQKYFQRPIHLFGGLGLLSFLLGGVINVYLLVLKIMGEDIWGRPILILGFILIVGGIQLITTGIIAEIIVRTYFESQDKKTYRIKGLYTGEQEVQTSN